VSLRAGRSYVGLSKRKEELVVFASKQIAIGIVAVAGLTAGVGAAFTSQQAPQKHELRAFGLGVVSVTPATREARVSVQCGDGRGELRTVKLPRRLDLSTLTPGTTVGAVVLTPDNVVVRVMPAAAAACDGDTLEGAAVSATDTMAADEAQTIPSQTQAATPEDGASNSRTTTTAARVAKPTPSARGTWTFLGKAKRDDLGALSLDVDTVNLPARYVTERYLLSDHDVRMVVSRATAIGDLAGRRTPAQLLDDATVRVQATIAAPSAWRRDDEGRRVPTIIAKRIVVLELDQ
jgi:hypothetical protein